VNAHKPPEILREYRSLDFSSAAPGMARQPQSVRTLHSAALFAGRTEIIIDHDGALCRLKITRQGKLILNK
jgi:hemin uptake protein HemP